MQWHAMQWYDWYMEGWVKATDFRGRARRKEYWAFFLGNGALGLVFGLMDRTIFGVIPYQISPDNWISVSPISTLFTLLILVPGVAVAARRLHDVGRGARKVFGITVLALVVADVIPGLLLYSSGSAFDPDPESLARATSLQMVLSYGAWIWPLILLCTDSQPGENRYGPNPKEIQ